MQASLLYKLHSHNQTEGVQADPNLFKEVYTSQFNLVRIFQVLNISESSREFARRPENRLCDAPGSWFCRGQYPPALNELFTKRKAFKQLEDFNTEASSEDAAYQK